MTRTMTITLIMTVAFFAIMIFVGIRSRRHASDVAGFVLGSRNVGPWLTAFAYGTSYFSAVIFVGYAGQFGWNFGIASTWIGLSNAFIGSLLAWLILGRRTRIMTNHLGCKTMPEFFGARYGSRTMKIVSSVIIFVFLIPYTASLYNGLSRLFAMAFPGVDYGVCVLVMAALTGVYVVVGGYMATALNDFIQGLLMLFGIVAVIAAVLNANGGFYASLESLVVGEGGSWEYASFFGPDPVSLLFVVLLTSLGTWGLPQMVGKFYAIKNEDAVKKGTVISTLFAIVVAGGCYFLGGFGRLYPVDVAAEGYDAIIPQMLSTLSPAIIGVVIVLVLSASMSTLSSLVLTSSSTITLDFLAPLSRKGFTEKRKMLLMRLFIVVFVAVSAWIAIRQAHSRSLFIAQTMGISWGALAGAFLAPFLYGLYSPRTSRAAVWVSFVLGVGIEIVQLFVSLGSITLRAGSFFAFMFRNSLYSGVFAMVLGILIVPLVSSFTASSCPYDVDATFSCYGETRSVDVTENLGD